MIDCSPDGGIERSDNHHRDAETELGYDSSGRSIHSVFWDILHDETFFTFDEHGRLRLKDEVVQEFGEDVFHLDEVGTYDALGRLRALALRRVPGTPTIATTPPLLEHVVRYYCSDGGVLERMELDRKGECVPEGVRTVTHDAQGSIIAEHSTGAPLPIATGGELRRRSCTVEWRDAEKAGQHPAGLGGSASWGSQTTPPRAKSIFLFAPFGEPSSWECG